MKKHRRIVLMAAVLLNITILAGCWDAIELEDLSIPLVAAVDNIRESEKEYPDDKYLVTIGVPVFYEDAKEKFHIIDATGQMIGEARGRRNAQLGERVVFGQLQIIVFGQELAKKENLQEILDLVVRSPKTKASTYLLISKERAVETLKKPVHGYPNVGIYLKALIKNSKETNFYPSTTIFDLNRDLINYGSAAILPHVSYKDGEIRLSGSCLINDGKMAAEMGREETEAIVMLRGIKCRGTLSFDVIMEEELIDKATFEGENSRKVKLRKEDDKYIIDIQVGLAGRIVEHKKQKPVQDGTDLMKAFKESLEQHIKKRAEALVEKTQEEFKFDALRLGGYIKAHTREKLTKEDIDKIIQEAEINVDVKVQILDVGGKM